MFAVVNLYKPPGPTSHTMINALRRVFDLKKVGHAGTLDPLAEGVLPICLGKATRLIEYFPTDKRYEATICFGRTTTTLDKAGEVVEEQPCQLTAEAVSLILPCFIGIIQQQVPPQSAIHVAGKKLYKYYQQGIPVELPTREVTIHDLTLQSFHPDPAGFPTAVVQVHCSTGTYIRSLARDIGVAVGTVGMLDKLVRTAHGSFTADSAVPLDTLQESDDPSQYLENPARYLSLPTIELTEEAQAKYLSNGMKIDWPEAETQKPRPNALYWITRDNRPVSVAQLVQHRLKPIKVFSD